MADYRQVLTPEQMAMELATMLSGTIHWGQVRELKKVLPFVQGYAKQAGITLPDELRLTERVMDAVYKNAVSLSLDDAVQAAEAGEVRKVIDALKRATNYARERDVPAQINSGALLDTGYVRSIEALLKHAANEMNEGNRSGGISYLSNRGTMVMKDAVSAVQALARERWGEPPTQVQTVITQFYRDSVEALITSAKHNSPNGYQALVEKQVALAQQLAKTGGFAVSQEDVEFAQRIAQEHKHYAESEMNRMILSAQEAVKKRDYEMARSVTDIAKSIAEWTNGTRGRIAVEIRMLPIAARLAYHDLTRIIKYYASRRQ